MPPISHLLMLIAAFFGADLSGARVDIAANCARPNAPIGS